jgi:hypothetical protein
MSARRSRSPRLRRAAGPYASMTGRTRRTWSAWVTGWAQPRERWRCKVCSPAISVRAGPIVRAGPGALCPVAAFESINRLGLTSGNVLARGCGGGNLIGRVHFAAFRVMTAGELTAVGVGCRNRRPCAAGRFGRRDLSWGRQLRCRLAGGAVGWCGDVAVHPQIHQATAMTLPQPPFTMPLVLAAKRVALRRIIARRGPVPGGRYLRPREKLELPRNQFSRIRTGECQGLRRVDHAKSVPRKIT